MHNIPSLVEHKIKSTLLAAVTLAVAGQFFVAHPTYAASEHPASVVTRIIVKFRPSAKNASGTMNLSAMGVGDTAKTEALSGQMIRITLSDEAQLTNTLASLNGSAEVAFAEVDETFQPLTLEPNDTLFGEQLQYQNARVLSDSYGINLPEAWDVSTGVPTVTVAVIDTGIRADHPEFAGRIVDGFDFIASSSNGNDGDGRDSDPSDPGDGISLSESTDINSPYYGCATANSTWHGTAMAGLLGATGNNHEGIAGVNWQSKILPLRVLGKCGGSSSDIADAIRWAAGFDVPGTTLNTHPAQVMNLSLGRPGRCSNTLQSAIDDATAAGAVIVVAAGNSGINASNASPANCKGVIVIGASTLDGYRAHYSNYGSVVSIAAPGGNTAYNTSDALMTTADSGTQQPAGPSYKAYRGTSISTAVASGVISLMKSVQPSLTASEIITILQHTATPYSNIDSCTDDLCAKGIINAGAAVAAARDFTRAVPTSASTSNTLFLPAVTNNHDNVIVASSNVVAISNGDFEANSNPWDLTSNRTDQPVIASQSQLPSGVKPYQGSNVVWLGGMDNADTAIEQQLVVPGNASTLTLHTRIQSSDNACKQDFAYILINGVTVQRIALCMATVTNDWSIRRIDLSAYADQQISLKIRVTTGTSTYSQMFIDMLQFES